MRFRVRRTSVRYGANVSPCDEATKGKIEVWDCRTFKSPEDHDARCGQKWVAMLHHPVLESFVVFTIFAAIGAVIAFAANSAMEMFDDWYSGEAK